MSTKRKLPPIQLAPFKPFTLRLIDGHFVRVPKAENLPVTDATRPSAEPLPDPAGQQDAPTQIPPMPVGRKPDPAGQPAAAPTQIPPAPPARKPDPNSWSYPFRTRVDPSDPPAKP